MPSASTANAPPSTCLRRLPGFLLRRLGLRLDNALLLYKIVDLAVARKCLLELGVNGLHLPNEHRLRFRDRASEIIARRCLQQSLIDRELVEREGRREPGWRGCFPPPLVRLTVRREERIRRAFEMRLVRREQADHPGAALENGIVLAAAD